MENDEGMPTGHDMAGPPLTPRAGIWDKMMRAAMLDVRLYEEVEADTEGTSEALKVVIIASVLGGIGMGGEILSEQGRNAFLKYLLLGSLSTLMAWLGWAYLTYVIGARIFPGPQTQATYGELLRTIGFAASPGVIQLFGVITPLRWPSFLIAGVWSLIAMVIAVRQALDLTTSRAIGTCLIGWVIQAIFLVFFLVLFQ